jgi:hypothetical protein
MRPEIKGAIAGAGAIILGRWGGGVAVGRWPGLRRWSPRSLTSRSTTPGRFIPGPERLSDSYLDEHPAVASSWDQPMTTIRIDLDAAEMPGASFQRSTAPDRIGFTRSMSWGETDSYPPDPTVHLIDLGG